MSGFKEPSFADRQKAALQARQDILNKFRARPGPDDPAVKQRQAGGEAQAAARAKAKEARETEKAERKRLEAEADRGRGLAGPRKGRSRHARARTWKPNARSRATPATPRARTGRNSCGFPSRLSDWVFAGSVCAAERRGQPLLSANIRLMFHAMVTKLHSPSQPLRAPATGTGGSPSPI